MPDQPGILCTRRMPPNVEARLARDYDATLNPEDRLYSEDGLVQGSEGQDGIFCAGGDPMTAGVIERLPESVGIIATYSVGYEHVAVEAAKARGIVVTNTPDVLNDATADVAMLCLLGAARRGAEGDRMVRAGEWVGWHSTMMLGVHVTGKRLGIFGMGRIGRAVARRARGFDMEIHYNNRSRLAPELECGAVWHDTPDSLMAVSDFLSINAPSTPQTRRFLDAERIALLPDGAVVINTARGTSSTTTRSSRLCDRARWPRPDSMSSRASRISIPAIASSTTRSSSRTSAARATRRATRWGIAAWTISMRSSQGGGARTRCEFPTATTPRQIDDEGTQVPGAGHPSTESPRPQPAYRTSRKYFTAKSTMPRIGNSIDRASPMVPWRTPSADTYSRPITGK